LEAGPQPDYAVRVSTEPGAATEPSEPAEPSEPDDPLVSAWAAVEADWESADAHKKFLALSDSLDRLAEAGKRYRAVKETDATRRAAADKHIEQLLGLAMKRVRVDKVEPTKQRSRVEWIAFGVSIVLISAALFSAFRMIAH